MERIKMKLEFECDDMGIERNEGYCWVAAGYKFYLLYFDGIFIKRFHFVRGFNNIEEFNQMKEKIDMKLDYCLVTCENEVIWVYASDCEMEFYPLGRSIMNKYSNIEESAEVVNQKEEAAGKEADEVIKVDDSRTFLEIVRDLEMLLFRIGNMENSVNNDIIREHMLAIEYVLYKDYICSTKVS